MACIESPFVRRPALLVAANGIQRQHGLFWVVMISRAENRGWDGDVEVSDLLAAGLPVASVVRPAKIATIEAREGERIGSLPAADRLQVARHRVTELAGTTD